MALTNHNSGRGRHHRQIYLSVYSITDMGTTTHAGKYDREVELNMCPGILMEVEIQLKDIRYIIYIIIFENQSTDIIFIQKTHLSEGEEARFKTGWIGHHFLSSLSSARNGAMILV